MVVHMNGTLGEDLAYVVCGTAAESRLLCMMVRVMFCFDAEHLPWRYVCFGWYRYPSCAVGILSIYIHKRAGAAGNLRLVGACAVPPYVCSNTSISEVL